MATKKNAKPTTRQGTNNSGSDDRFYIPPASIPSNPPTESSEMGFIIAFISMVVVFALLLPIIGFMYLDILAAKKETAQQQEQVKRLINKMEKKE
jgi:hypothetical protein